jgi:hypothetical protein
MASIVGRGPRARCIRIIFSGTGRSLFLMKFRVMQNLLWLLAAYLHRSLAQAQRPALASRYCITLKGRHSL